MKAVSIYPDSKGRSQFELALSAHDDVQLCRSFDQVPDWDTLARTLRAWVPGVVFIDITVAAIELLNAQLIKEFPEIRRVAIHPAQVPEVFRRVLHLGMAELVNPPFRPAHFGPVLERLRADLEKNPVQLKSSCRTWAFLPSKAGAGASTLAAHTAWASAQNRDARVLLADFDRYSGITSFQFNVVSDYTLQDALAASEDLDEDCWRRLVKPVRNLDLLVSRPADITESRLERFTANLFQFAQRNYTTILADLPDSLDTQTLSALHQADQVFLVTTPELPSLRLAKLKADALRKLDLGSRTRLLLNRFGKNALLTKDDISDAVGIEVFAEFPCDYAGVSESLRVARPAAKMLDAATGFVNAANIAANLPKRKKFIDRLSVPLTAYFRPTVPTSVLRS